MVLAGWYVKENPDCGLKFLKFECSKEYSIIQIGKESMGYIESILSSFAILAEHFGIGAYDSHYIFSPSAYRNDLYITSAMVIKHIGEILGGRICQSCLG